MHSARKALFHLTCDICFSHSSPDWINMPPFPIPAEFDENDVCTTEALERMWLAFATRYATTVTYSFYPTSKFPKTRIPISLNLLTSTMLRVYFSPYQS